ncbi:MAG: polysaccharide deacetylase family protein [Patescibacteria group bacterium]
MVRKLLKKPYRLLINSSKGVLNFFLPTARILLYHRVEDVINDPHKLCVNKNNFHSQIKFLKENFNIIPLVKLVQSIRKGRVDNNTIAITFDDGYADNLYNALPVLKEFKVPATVFLAAGYIGRNRPRPFYWDQNTPEIGQGKPMTLAEVKRLSSSRLIEIGGHTINHPKLASLSENEQFKEISGGKKILENALNIPLLSFAYPFGDEKSFTAQTVSLVKKVGYSYACANIRARVTARSDIYALPRFVVRNWGLEEFKSEFNKFI